MKHFILIYFFYYAISATKSENQIRVNSITCNKNITIDYNDAMKISYDVEREHELVKYLIQIENKSFELYPTNNMTNGDVQTSSESVYFIIKYADFGYAGNWQFSVKTKDPFGHVSTCISNCEVIIEQKVQVFPTNVVNIPENTDMKLYFNDSFDEVTDCQLVQAYQNSNGQNDYKLTKIEDKMNKIPVFDENCGIKMKVNHSMNGKWELQQNSGKYKVRKTEFFIQINLYNYYPLILNKKLTLIRGSKYNIDISEISLNGDKSNFCEWILPNGHKVISSEFNCNYKIERVTESHSGIWTCRFRVPNKIEFQETEIIVKVEDPIRGVETLVNASESESITLMCRTKFLNFKYCIFTMPNGTMVNLAQGMSTSRYEYYGHGYSAVSTDSELDSLDYRFRLQNRHSVNRHTTTDRYRYMYDSYRSYNSYTTEDPYYHNTNPQNQIILSDPETSECGLKINKPSQEDNGSWKCTMGWNDDNKVVSSYISVNSFDIQSLNISAKDVFVQKGDRFPIKCSVNARLSYCEVKHSPDLRYIITQNDNSSLENESKYVSTDLDNGICEIWIDRAESEHEGQWECKLGIEHLGKAVERDFEVTIRESYLISQWNEVLNEKKEVDYYEMSCHLAPEIDDSIRYCRWECKPSDNPDLTEEVSFDESASFFNSTLCYSRITHKLGKQSPPCTCYVRLKVESDKEISAQF